MRHPLQYLLKVSRRIGGAAGTRGAAGRMHQSDAGVVAWVVSAVKIKLLTGSEAAENGRDPKASRIGRNSASRPPMIAPTGWPP